LEIDGTNGIFALRLYATPLIKLERASAELGLDVYGKLECVCPTGSHKDRESLAMLEDASARGIDEIAIASTGNAAISLSALSPIYNIQCHVFISRGTSKERRMLIELFGAKLHLVDGGYREAVEECERFVASHNAYDANPGRSVKKLEGDSAIGIEISNQLDVDPEFVIVPTNNGTLLAGIWRGFERVGLKPKMVAATSPTTSLAESIAGYNRFDGEALDAALSESGGKVVELRDNEILLAMKKLFEEGVFCEPAAATSLAALYKLRSRAPLHGPIVLLITGTALKYPISLRMIARKILKT
jgi:threonine synthase